MAVTNVCYCYVGDSGISRKVFWVVANEAIAVEDIRCNRMLLKPGLKAEAMSLLWPPFFHTSTRDENGSQGGEKL